MIGASAVAWNEPAPYGMVLVKRGSVKMGPDKQDSLWGNNRSFTGNFSRVFLDG